MMSLGWSSQAISLTNRVLTRKSLNSLGRVLTRSENFFIPISSFPYSLTTNKLILIIIIPRLE